MATTENEIYYQDNYSTPADVPSDMKKMAESIDKKVGELTEDIDGLSNSVEALGKQNTNIAKDVSTNTTDISNIKQEQVTQNENISELQEKNEKLEAKNIELEEENKLLKKDLANTTIKGQANGENITIKDSAEVRFPMLKIKGNSKQETRKGYNRLKNIATSKNYGGIDYKINDDGSVTVNGTSEGSYINIGKIIAKEGETYILTGCPSGGSSNGYMLTTNIEAGNRDHDKGEGVSFSYAEGTEISINLRVASGTVVSNLTFYPMVRLSTETETKYEKYGATPSTEIPSEIKNAGDNTNEFDKDNAPEIVGYHWDNSVITSSPTLFTTYIKCESNTTYTVSKISGQRFALGTTEKVPAIGVQTANLVQNNTATSLKITTSNTAKYLIVGYYNSSADTLSKQEILDSIKIEKGSKATPYSPYNCGNANITICNENCLDLNKIEATSNATIEKTETGFVATRTNTSTSDLFVASVQLNLEKNQNYTIYENVSKQTILFIYKDRLFGEALPKTVLKSDSSTHCAQFTTDKTGKVVIGFYSQGQTQGDTLTLSNIMICKGKKTEAEMKEYIKGKSQSFTFPLSEGQRLYKDSYLSDDGIHHKRGQYQFTGNETLLTDLERTNTRRYYNNTKVVNAKSLVALSNRFVQADSVSDLNNNDNEKILTLNGGQFAFRLNKTTADGVTAVKQWLSENPVIVEYELAEEVIEPYTEEQLKVYKEIKRTAHSYKGITNIYSSNEISPEFDVIYSKDLEILFNQVNRALVEGGV